MPDILMTRIDNRLVHGQVGVAWTTALPGVNLIVWQMIWLLPTRCSKA